METRGINLKIDTDINYLCESSHSASSITRNFNYVLVFILFLACLNYINTSPGNWSSIRLNHINNRINSLEKEIQYQNSESLKNELELLKMKRNKIIDFTTQQSVNIQIPVFDSSFDVNNLTLISGISISLILFLIRISSQRELINLRYTLNAITERYTDDADKIDFYEILSQSLKKDKIDERIAIINKNRRRYHYEILRINDFLYSTLIFKSKIKVNIFSLPLGIYLCLILTDLMTMNIGFNMSYIITSFTIIYSLILILVIYKLCKDCGQIRNKIYTLYLDFEKKNYTYNVC